MESLHFSSVFCLIQQQQPLIIRAPWRPRIVTAALRSSEQRWLSQERHGRWSSNERIARRRPDQAAVRDVPDPAVMQILQGFTSSHGVFNSLDKYGKHLTVAGWMMLIEEIGKLNKWSVALDVFKWLRSQNWLKHNGTGLYSKLIAIMGKQGQLRLASYIFTELSNNGYLADTSIYNAIIMAHLRCKNVDKALETALNHFGEMKKTMHASPTVVTYNILTRACAQAGLIDKAEELFIEMMRRGLNPNVFTFNGIIDSYAKRGFYREMEFKLKEMNEYEVRPDLVTFNILIDAYGKAGDFVKMERVYKSMKNFSREKPSVITFNSMLLSYGMTGNLGKMEHVLVRMDMAGLGPDLGTYNALIASYGKAGEFHLMQSCFNKMTQSPTVQPQVSTLDALLQAYADHGMIEEAELLFINAHKVNIRPAVSSYLILFRAYGEECQLDKMTVLMTKMEQNGLPSGEEFLLRALESFAASGASSSQFEQKETYRQLEIASGAER